MNTITLASSDCNVKVSILGGRIDHFSTSSENNWIWLSPNNSGEDCKQGNENYDQQWRGGFEELFPNDAPVVFEGRALRDHGELWDSEWDVIECLSQTVTLRQTCETVPVEVTKKVSLSPSRPEVSICYTLENKSDHQLFYLFKLHPALRIEEEDRIILPGGGTVLPVDLGFSTIIGQSGPFQWPMVLDSKGKFVDLSIVGSWKSKKREFVYVKDLTIGQCGIRRAKTREEIRIEFPLAEFPFCWLFITYGGFLDHYTVVLEPCTNMPKDLRHARENGTCAVLLPKGKKQFDVKMSIHQS